jgi:hypothetical protein
VLEIEGMKRAQDEPAANGAAKKQPKLDAAALKAQLAQRLSKLKSKVQDAPGELMTGS